MVAAKLAAGLLAGLVFGVVGEGLGFAIGYATLSGRGISYALNGSQTTLLVLGTLAGVALWGALGVGLGLIVRNQVGAIIGLLAWGFVAENLLFAFVPSVGRFGPVHAQNALMGLTTEHLLPAAAGGATPPRLDDRVRSSPAPPSPPAATSPSRSARGKLATADDQRPAEALTAGSHPALQKPVEALDAFARKRLPDAGRRARPRSDIEASWLMCAAWISLMLSSPRSGSRSGRRLRRFPVGPVYRESIQRSSRRASRVMRLGSRKVLVRREAPW